MDETKLPVEEHIWLCKIGGPVFTDSLPPRADLPMRIAIQRAFEEVTGSHAEFIFSGWAGSLTEPERASHENRLPTEKYHREWCKREAVDDMHAALVEAEALLGVIEIDGGITDAGRTEIVGPLVSQVRAALAKARGEPEQQPTK